MSLVSRRISLRFCSARLAAISVTLFLAGNAVASNRQAQEKAARKACLSGDYATGVAILSDLFVETGTTNYIFNQGRCFEQNRRYEDAIARFQEYLRAGRDKLKDSDKVEAEKHIADCRQMLAQERELSPAKVAPEPVAVIPPSPPVKAETPPETSIAASQPNVETSPSSAGAGLRIGGIVTAAIGATALGAGILLNMMANSTVDSIYKNVDGYTKDPDRKSYTTLAWIGYGVGAACLATGAVLYIVGSSNNSSQSATVALSPSLGAGHTGVALSGAF